MPLTAAQLATLKAAIAANSATIPAGQPWSGAFAGQAVNSLPNDPDANAAVAGWYNLTASPDYWVWRTRVAKDEYANSTSSGGTTFAWTGAGFITRAQGERDAWREMFNGAGVGANAVNPSLPNVRQAFADIFSGATAPAPANRTHLGTVSRRRATNGEKIFVLAATGVGNDGVAGNRGQTTNPDAMAFEGFVTPSDVQAARALP